jgi:hypothetical protein
MRPQQVEAQPGTPTKKLSNSLADGTVTAREARRRASGYAVVVHNGDRWTRFLYLSLHSATQAVDRARARGADPYLVLVELMPVGEVTQ